MNYLFDNWDKLKRELSSKNLFLLLDYDGTLTPIVDTPDKAIAAPETKELLYQLSESPDCELAIISGRALSDIKNLIGLKKIIYVGNHGLEIEGPKIQFESQIPEGIKNILVKIKNELTEKLSGIKGVFIEDKGLSLSVHYRLAEQRQVPLIKSTFDTIIKNYSPGEKIKVTSGKEVLEVRPAIKWDKGKVALWLLARQQFAKKSKDIAVIYIGDDVTDEDAFAALKNKGITVCVGDNPDSRAGYYLRNTEEVIKFLKNILALRRGTSICQSC